MIGQNEFRVIASLKTIRFAKRVLGLAALALAW